MDNHTMAALRTITIINRRLWTFVVYSKSFLIRGVRSSALRRVQIAKAPKVYPVPTQAALISGFISQYWAVPASRLSERRIFR